MRTPLKPMNTSKSAKTTIWTIGYDDRVRKIFLNTLDEDESEDQKVVHMTAARASFYSEDMKITSSLEYVRSCTSIDSKI